jgi:hypothetical protein
MTRSLLSAALALFIQLLPAQVWIWDSVLGNHPGAMVTVRDRSGNLYLYLPTSQNMPQYPIPVKKLDSQGHFQWQIGLPGNIQLLTLVTSPDSSIYLGGNFSQGFMLGGQTYTCAGLRDIWIAKYTASGQFAWCKTIGGKKDDIIGELCMAGSDLVITGWAGDTINIMGQSVPKNRHLDLFVAKTYANGVFQAVKFSTVQDTATYGASGFGYECAADPWGNIFVLARFQGRHQVDTFRIGMEDYPHNGYGGVLTTALLKFDPQLHLQYANSVYACSWHCDGVDNLVVNNNGEAYYVRSYDYGQSGNDDHYSWINRISPAGALTATYQPRPDRKSTIFDLELDDCGNVYYTGICRNYINSPIVYATLMSGQLSPALVPNWRRLDSTQHNWVTGISITPVTPNFMFVTGYFSDSLNLWQSLATAQYGADYFAARLWIPATPPCELPLSSDEMAPIIIDEFGFHPNPCSDRVVLRIASGYRRIRIYTMTGVLMYEKEITSNESDVDVELLPEGIYALHASSETGSRTGKLVIAR